MNRIDTSFASVSKFFERKNTETDQIPEHLSGIWELSDLKNMSILTSFNNAEFDKTNRRIIVKLYEPGNWLFGEENLTNNFFVKLLKYSYQFDFDEHYEYATIKIKLGRIPIYIPDSISKWTVEFDKKEGKMIRKTTFFKSVYRYEATRVTDEDELAKIHNCTSFFYC